MALPLQVPESPPRDFQVHLNAPKGIEEGCGEEREGLRGGRNEDPYMKAPSHFGVHFHKKAGPKKRPKKDPPFEHFLGPQKTSKSGPRQIFWGLGGDPKKGTPYRGPKSDILLLFTTFPLGPGSQKVTPFRDRFGEPFS